MSRLLLLICLPALGLAAEEKRPAAAGSAELEAAQPIAPAPVGATTVPVLREPSRSKLPPSPAVSWKALKTADGEARLLVDGTEQTVRPGSRLGGDLVKSVSPGRLVLERGAGPDDPRGQALVIVTFDAAGQARTRVLWTRDPTAHRSPEVRQP